jgi:hypothetical protein
MPGYHRIVAVKRIVGPDFAGVAIALAASVWALTAADLYQDNLRADHPAIRYDQAPVSDRAAQLNQKLERGEIKLDYRDGGLGYLPSLLEQLGVNPDSQALVFSKTSFQAGKISPRNPRAIYFNDDVAVGWVRGGDGFEIAALDPKQGVIFYTLDIHQSDRPRLARQSVCLQCHQGPATSGVPGIFIGSVYPNSAGTPYQPGAIVTDHRTAFKDRWGGWYVNATQGEQPDRANAVASDPAEPEVLHGLGLRGSPNNASQNLTSLIGFGSFNPAGYLTPVSDIVALMTFEHQTQMVNFMTRLNWEARIAEHDQKPASPAVNSDIESLVTYMLFAEEAPLTQSIQGVSTFTSTFPKPGPRDRKGRSLRDFDLNRRLFRYPLSYMIYSAAFDALPETVRDRVYRRIYEVLTSREPDPKFERLSGEDRKSIIEILRDTKPNLPAYWRAVR